MIFHRSPGVPVLDHSSDYRDYLRHDFNHRCAYCLTHEQFFEGGEGGQIDHHRPMHPPAKLGKDFSHLEHVYENLYWTCSTCNRSKGNRWPTDWQYSHGRRFLDPCQEDHDNHWAMHADGTVTHTSQIGNYTINQIRLNRPPLRRRRAMLYQHQEKIRRIEAELLRRDLADELRAAYEDHLADLRKMVDPPEFQE